MKKILAILIALLAALSVQTVAFADGEMMPLQPAQTESIADGNSVELNDDLTDSQGIKYGLNANDQTAIVSGHTDTLSEVITIPATVTKDGVKYTVTSIGDGAFERCSGLTSVTIPDSVTSIGDDAFERCSGLTSVTIPGSVTSIGNGAFSYCKGLTSVTIPGSVTSIGYGAFSECSGLTSVDILDGVTSIGDFAFVACDGLTSVTIPDSVTSIGDYAFSECSGLTSVTIPDGVTSIGNYAFSYCTDLTSVTIPDSVTSIGNRAFGVCSALTKITFEGANPPSFDLTAFDYCNNLQTISLSADMTQEQQAAWKSALKAAGLDNKDIQFTGDLISEPTPTPDPTPTTPPADNNTAAEAASTPTVQQMESAERPDPQDVEATERYNFWMDVKADLRAAADGKTLRVHVPADYTNMPASVMEQIRLLDADVTVDLRWNGERLTITPATAQRKTALKAFWTFAQLCELYAQ